MKSTLGMSLHEKIRFTLAPAAVALAVMACQGSDEPERDDYDDSPIAEATEDLREAAEDRDEGDAEELRASFEDTKKKLAKLRERMARADQGVTEEVMEERRELKEAMRTQMEDVREQIAEAEAAARAYNQLNDEAAKLLEETAPPNVEAQVEVRLRELPSKIDVSAKKQVERIEYETNVLPKEQGEGASDDSKSTDDEPRQRAGETAIR